MFQRNEMPAFPNHGNPAINTDFNGIDLAALFSWHVYGGAEVPSIPAEWEIIASAEYNSGYKATSYAKNFGRKNCTIITAHRGTVPNNVINIIDDIRVAFGKVPFQMQSAQDFLSKVRDKVIKKYQESDNPEDVLSLKFANTGHSLGGIISDIMGSFGSGGASITFDNPGSKECFINYMDSFSMSEAQKNYFLSYASSACICFQSDVNAINTCNTQAGITVQLVDLPYEYNLLKQPEKDLSSNFLRNIHYLVAYTLQQHSMQNIYYYIYHYRPSTTVSYPVGFKNGYIEYLNPLRKRYWDGYIDYVWYHDDKLRKEYEHIKENFSKWFYTNLKAIRNEAIENKFTGELEPIYSQPNEIKNNSKSSDALIISLFKLTYRQAYKHSINPFKNSRIINNLDSIQSISQIQSLANGNPASRTAKIFESVKTHEYFYFKKRDFKQRYKESYRKAGFFKWSRINIDASSKNEIRAHAIMSPASRTATILKEMNPKNKKF